MTRLSFAGMLFLLGCGTSTPPAPEAAKAPLDAFVADTTGFAWAEAWSTHEGGVSTSILSVTSQSWRTTAEVDRPEWKHAVGISWFDGAPTRTALVVLVGGSNDKHIEPGDSNVKTIENLALVVGTPVIFVSGVPSNPLSFVGGGQNLTEDALVAPTWDKVLTTREPTWSAYFPMTRAVIRSLDAVQAFMAQQGHPIERFVVTGYSKRGAATYLVAAADPRVVAMAPGVFDFLDFRAQAAHHLAVYGAPAAAVKPYADFDLLNRLATPEADPLLATSDPFAYRDRFTMPKLIISSPGDQFFLPDSMRYYLSSLPGETLVRVVPNTDHTLANATGDSTDGLSTLTGWYRALVAGKKRPHLTWALAGGVLTVRADQTIEAAQLWQATNPTARDFRREVIGLAYVAAPLEVAADGTVTASVQVPAQGFTCFFVEVTIAGTKYSTQAFVSPD
jgi:PhoPQ-activated pathogenicity-related protein